MNLVTTYMTQNGLYSPRDVMPVRGLMFHSLGMPVSSPEEMYRRWNKPSYTRASIHGFVGAEEVRVVEPCLESPGKAMRAWHSASGKKGRADADHLGFEMCEPSCVKYTHGATFTVKDKDRPAAVDFVTRATRNMAELFAHLCRFHRLDPLKDGVILSHAEAYKRGLASNHGDPGHLWNQLGMDYDMDKFRADVVRLMKEEKPVSYEQWKQYMDRYLKEQGELPASGWAGDILAKAKQAGITDGSRPRSFSTREEVTAMVAAAMK